MSSPGDAGQGPVAPVWQPFGPPNAPAAGAWLIIINVLGLIEWGAPFFPARCPHAILPALIAAHFLSPLQALTPTAASSLFANQADGYGVDKLPRQG